MKEEKNIPQFRFPAFRGGMAESLFWELLQYLASDQALLAHA